MSTTETHREYHRFEDGGFTARVLIEASPEFVFMDEWLSDEDSFLREDERFESWYAAIVMEVLSLSRGVSLKIRRTYPTENGFRIEEIIT